MRSIAAVALTTSAIFLLIVAILLYSAALFYMATAMIVTIAACRVQAWLSVRGLRFERYVPDTVRVGDRVTVEITAWSERQIRRPLITVTDHLPARMVCSELSPSLPIAPAFGQAVVTRYQFRPMVRGRYRWTALTVVGTDALGLVPMARRYEIPMAELTVLPQPIPVSLDLVSASGWGAAEAEFGRSRGAGIEPRGIREYVPGDSLRYIHWRSSAKAGQLLVKEFETGSYSSLAFVVQSSRGSDVGSGAHTSLELMCGHLAYVCARLLRQGAAIEFPGLELRSRAMLPQERETEILYLLAELVADSDVPVSQRLLEAIPTLVPGTQIVVTMTVADEGMSRAVSSAATSGYPVTVLVYDASAFESKRKEQVHSAAEADYMARLESAGARVVLMPTEWGAK
jgi:uncharacterized protein (DUF58 family)